MLADIPIVKVSPDLSARFADKQSICQIKTTNITARTPISRIKTFYAVDIETTGLSPVENELLQVAAIKFVDFEPVEAFVTFVKPRARIPVRTQKINRITPQMVKGAPRIESIIKQFDDFLTDSTTGENPPIVGHNLSFDQRFLCANGSHAFLDDRVFYDTLEMSRRQFSTEKSFKLDSLTKSKLKILRDDAHTSLSDSLVTGLLFKKICEERMGI